MHLSQPSSIEKLVVASGGYDLPAYEKLTTLKVWAEAEPPKGTLYHYPNPYNHQKLSIAASPAPPKVAQQIYTQATLTKMVPALRARRANGKDARLGGRRVRRLHAELKTGDTPSVGPSNGSEMAKRAHSLVRAAISIGRTKCPNGCAGAAGKLGRRSGCAAAGIRISIDNPTSALGQKPKFCCLKVMSALARTADIARGDRQIGKLRTPGH